MKRMTKAAEMTADEIFEQNVRRTLVEVTAGGYRGISALSNLQFVSKLKERMASDIDFFEKVADALRIDGKDPVTIESELRAGTDNLLDILQSVEEIKARMLAALKQ